MGMKFVGVLADFWTIVVLCFAVMCLISGEFRDNNGLTGFYITGGFAVAFILWDLANRLVLRYYGD